MRILIIEDDPIQGKWLAEMCQPLSNEIALAESMKDAAEIIEKSEHPPEFITIDLNLPDSNWRNTIDVKIREIRAKAPESLIVVITGLPVIGDRKKIIEQGANDVFEKLDVATPASFMSKLHALVLELVKMPGTDAHLRILEAVTACIGRQARAQSVQ